MPLIGIIAKKRDVQAIKKELQSYNVEIIEITKESITNIRNVNFDEIIFLEDINLETREYKYMKKIIANAKYLILNGDIEISIFKEMKMENPVKIITFGFNMKSTITVSSVKNEKIMVCLQRNIIRIDGEIIEAQEKKILISKKNSKKIYNKLVVFIVKEMHNL